MDKCVQPVGSITAGALGMYCLITGNTFGDLMQQGSGSCKWLRVWNPANLGAVGQYGLSPSFRLSATALCPCISTTLLNKLQTNKFKYQLNGS